MRGDKKRITVAIGGNPNSGKTTIFNYLTGSHQRVGNWGGVTVEKIEGSVEHRGYEIVFVDLPGTYSLTAYSMEEIIARDFIVEQKPDVVVDILDSSNLERNMYLAVQMIEMKGRFIFVLNMADMAEKQGIKIDAEKLSTLIGGPVIFTTGNRGIGVREILDKVVDVYEGRESHVRHIHIPFGREVEEEIKKIQAKIREDETLASRYSTRWLSVKLIENDSEVIEKVKKNSGSFDRIMEQVQVSRDHLRNIFGDEPEIVITDQRYGFITGLLKEVVSYEKASRVDVSQKIDKVLTNRILGIPILIFFIWLMFQITFGLGSYPMDWIDSGVSIFSNFLSGFLNDGIFKSLLIDGIIGGVGSVLVFLPNILLLFFMISIFEDTGYMARAAFVMDRVMHLIGLHGKSFIPMIMGFGCNVPAIMATRTLESKKDRLLTILINPLMSCSARLPVYILIAGTFFGKKAGDVIFSLYALGIVLAVLIGRFFRKTILKGESEPFVMELPPYRIPTLKSVIIHMWERAVVFLKKMGTVILIGSIIVWFLSNFPGSLEKPQGGEPSVTENVVIEHSYITSIGKAIEPIFRPLGFGWREGVALLSGFVAKEIVVSTLGVLYNGDTDSGSRDLGEAIKEKSGFTPLSAYAFLVFVLIYTPCLATVVAIRRETGSTGWTFFSVGYQLTLAWLLAFTIVHVGKFIALGLR